MFRNKNCDVFLVPNDDDVVVVVVFENGNRPCYCHKICSVAKLPNTSVCSFAQVIDYNFFTGPMIYKFFPSMRVQN